MTDQDDLVCALCYERWWERVEPCCTVSTDPRKTYCTDCCPGDLHDDNLFDDEYDPLRRAR